jgi:hypothetical protein
MGQVRAGKAICWRCKRPILPDEPWDLGHADDDPNHYADPEHRACNRGQPAREAWAARAAAKAESAQSGMRWSRHWFGDHYDAELHPCGASSRSRTTTYVSTPRFITCHVAR